MNDRLSNLSFVIPFRIDSTERSRNVDILLDFIIRHFDSPVYLMEADAEKRYTVKSQNSRISYHFVEDRNPVFQHTLYLNCLYQLVQTPFMAGWDTDVLVTPYQIKDTVEQLIKGDSVMGLPYNGYAMLTHQEHVEEYQTVKNWEIFVQHTDDMISIFGSLSAGGAFIVNRDVYLQSGGENENFLGWGPEDFERVKRMEILFSDFPIYRAKGCLFHLYHPRKLNSWYANPEYEINGKQEFLKICAMNTDELRTYVNSWPWLKRFHPITYYRHP